MQPEFMISDWLTDNGEIFMSIFMTDQMCNSDIMK